MTLQSPSAQPQVIPEEQSAPFTVSACSVCLRVDRSSTWVDPEVVIVELRSFELSATPRLTAGICDRCSETIRARRAAARKA